MKYRFIGRSTVVGLLSIAFPVMAHHSVQAQFDFEKPITLTGTLTKFQWINPHSYAFLDVKDASGKVTNWGLETVGPGGLRKAGLSREGGFKVGDTYTVEGFAAKDGTNTAFAKAFKFPDGRLVTIWFGDPNAR